MTLQANWQVDRQKAAQLASAKQQQTSSAATPVVATHLTSLIRQLANEHAQQVCHCCSVANSSTAYLIVTTLSARYCSGIGSCAAEEKWAGG